MMIPLNNYLVVEIDTDSVEKEQDGFIVPDTAQKKPYIGKVIAVSDNIQNTVSVGDTVVWPSTLGVETEVEKKKVIVLQLEDVLMKLR